MQISSIKKTMIDAHLHLGKDLIYDDRDTTEEGIIDSMIKNNLSKVLLFPANSNTGLSDERERNYDVISAVKRNSDKFSGVCSVNPNQGEDVYVKEVKTYLENGLEGIYVNPLVHGWDPVSTKGELVFKTAKKLRVPLFIATTIGIPFGLPERIFYLCKEHPDVKVVLQHACRSLYYAQTMLVAKASENIYFETSFGPDMRTTKKLITMFGSQRVIMGSETLDDIPHSQYVYSHIGLSASDHQWCTKKTIASLIPSLNE